MTDKKKTKKKTMKIVSAEVKVQLLEETAHIPEKAYESDAAFDLYASHGIRIPGNNTGLIPTGIALEIPEGFYMQIEDRSGMAANNHVHVLAGKIDSSYRNEVRVVMVNHNYMPFSIEPGTRIAQIELRKVLPITFKSVKKLSKTDRGEGFGSSGE